ARGRSSRESRPQRGGQFRPAVRLAQQLHIAENLAGTVDPGLWKAGGQHDLEGGPAFRRHARQGDPVQPARHHDIAKQQIDRFALEQLKRRLSAIAFKYAIPEFAELSQYDAAYRWIVFDDQDRLSSGRLDGVRLEDFARQGL